MKLEASFKVGVVGVGSPFGADNVGQRVIALLKQSSKSKAFKIEYFDRPGMHLLDYVKNFNALHLVDAIISEKPVGTIHRYEGIEVLQESNQQLSSHGFGVAEVLLLGEALECLPKEIIIHGIEIDKESLKNTISNTINNVCETLAKKIEMELLQYQT